MFCPIVAEAETLTFAATNGRKCLVKVLKSRNGSSEINKALPSGQSTSLLINSNYWNNKKGEIRQIAEFENKKVSRHYNEASETCFFSIVDIVAALTESANPNVYLKKLKKREVG